MPSDSCNDFVTKVIIGKESMMCKAGNQLKYFTKANDEESPESAFKVLTQWVYRSILSRVTEHYDPMVTGIAVSKKRPLAVIAAKSIARETLKLKPRSILSTDSTHEAPQSRWPSHTPGVTDLHRSFWPIACFLARNEDEESPEYLLSYVTECFFSLAGEATDNERTMCDNSCAIFNAIQKNFPLAARLH